MIKKNYVSVKHLSDKILQGSSCLTNILFGENQQIVDIILIFIVNVGR